MDRRYSVSFRHEGKKGTTVLLDSGPLIVAFRGEQLMVGGVAAYVMQLYVDGVPSMPAVPGGIPAVVFSLKAHSNGISIPICPKGKQIKLEVLFEEDGVLQAQVLGQKQAA